MIELQSNILVTDQNWQPAESLRKLPGEHYEPLVPIRLPNIDDMLDAAGFLAGIRREQPAVDDAPYGWTTVTILMPLDWTVTAITTGTVYLPAPVFYIKEDRTRKELPPDFRSVIELLPITKRAEVEKALSQIKGYLIDIEASEDGEVIIETQEDGLDCFYAICTEEGDFKGTWLTDGRLRRQPWSANLPYGHPALSPS